MQLSPYSSQVSYVTSAKFMLILTTLTFQRHVTLRDRVIPHSHFLFASSNSFSVRRTVWPQYTLQTTDKQTTDGHNTVAKPRLLVRSANDIANILRGIFTSQILLIYSHERPL